MGKEKILKKKVDSAINICKELIPEVYAANPKAFTTVAKAISMMDDESFRRLAERSAATGNAVRFVNATVTDFHRINDLYLSQSDEMNQEYGEKGALKLEDYPKENIPNESPNHKQVENAPHFISENAEMFRKVLQEELAKQSKGYEYPKKNIPVESSINQSANDAYVQGDEARKLLEADEKELSERLETTVGGGWMGDGLMLHDKEVSKMASSEEMAPEQEASTEVAESNSEASDMAFLFGDDAVADTEKPAAPVAQVSANRLVARNSIPAAVLASAPTKRVSTEKDDMEFLFGKLGE